MPKMVRYRTGLVLKGCYCSFCDARRTGTVFQEGSRWMLKMECGHLGFRGWTQDPDELERLGLINASAGPDPRLEQRNRQAEEDRMREAQEKLDFELRQASKRGEIK